MKFIIVLVALFCGIFYCRAEEITTYSERLYYFKVVSFSRVYDIYCTKASIGYYKYEIIVGDSKLYITYETKDFYKQCSFDENEFIDVNITPSNMWTNNKGESLNMKKRFGPVIEKDRIKKKYPYGYGEN